MPARRPLTPTYLFRLACGLGGYAVGGLVTPLMLLWIGGVLPGWPVAAGVDRAVSDALWGSHLTGWAAVAADLGLVLAFGLQHSIMAAPRCKQWLTRRVPASLERTVYVVAASLTLLAAMVLWQPLPAEVWRLDGTAAHVATGAWLAGCGVVYLSALWLDHFHLLGLRQAWRGDPPPSEPSRLHTGGPYHLVRHPLMTGLLLAFWAAPVMTAGHLLFAAAMTGYIVIGTLLEERKLHREHGAAYADYVRWTPMLVPRPWPLRRDRRTGRTAPVRPRPIVRRPGIDYDAGGAAVWYGDNVVATAVLNAYSILFPPLERFMADEMRAANREVGDPALAARVRSFAGQEDSHAREHQRTLATLTARGYRVGLLDRIYRALAHRVLRGMMAPATRRYFGSPGITAMFAGVEHWTATLAEVALSHRYPARLYGPMFSVYYWHAAEELEHKSVVADVLDHLRGGYLVRVLMFLIGTLVFGALTLVGTSVMLVQIGRVQGRGLLGWLVYPVRILADGVRYFLVEEKMALHGTRALLAYLRPGFHPDQRDTDHLIAHALELAGTAGAEVSIPGRGGRALAAPATPAPSPAGSP